MTCPKPHPLIAAANEPDLAKRMQLVREFTGPIFERAAQRRAAGICAECDEPVVGGDDAIRDSYCVTHAREVEIEFLAADQRWEEENDG